jgi:lysophospholipid acyltransferase (LPLAT)-like uncharacterized protein
VSAPEPPRASPRRRWRRALSRPLARLAALALPALHQAWMRLVWRTSRVEDAGLGRLREIAARHGGAVALVWHEDLLLAPYACARLGLRPATLVSVSDAGEIATRLLERCGFAVLRGGSSRGRSRSRPLALRELIRHARREPHGVCALAVDGSHGPRRRLKRGALALARATGRPIVLARISARPCLRLPSWDRLVLPLPFGAIRLALRGPYATPPEAATRGGRERFRARLERELALLAEAGERAPGAAAAPATRSESG